ncbi:Activator of stress genes 1 [Madurella mycetomatis]|uniref:Activator of stress genes 1 n=1 Tax=Madurella mycetomatis TaxID=100816 RepID=A0A175WEW9_9PEZI|nr:Activator of stress genes 1 [Madurella mycetomatis]
MANRAGFFQLLTSLRHTHQTQRKEHQKALEPITVFVDSMMPIQKRMTDILPPRSVCDRLIQLYFAVSEGLYRIIHIPSFKKEYADYWDGKGCGESFLPRLLCMLCISARLGTDSRGLGHDRYTSVHIPTACVLVRHWLDELRRKHLAELTTLQTELLLLHAQKIITPQHQTSWAQLGYVVRMAMTMSLQRDPSELPGVTKFLGECRRRLWFTLIEMDLHVSVACNLPSAVRQGEYSCEPPGNFNDADLFPTMSTLPDSKTLDQLTTNHLQAYCARTLPVRIDAAVLVSQIDTLQDYTVILEVGSKLERLLDDVHRLFPSRHGDLNLHIKERRHRAQLDLQLRRPLMALYRPLAVGGPPNCPLHISQAYLRSCMAMLAIYLDGDHNLEPTASEADYDPRISEGHDELGSMFHSTTARDVIDAAFGVCWYIKMAQGTGGDRVMRSSGWNSNPHGEGESEAVKEGRYYLNPYPWPVRSMVETVEGALEKVTGLVGSSTEDLRDLVALAIVLGCVQPGRTEEKMLKSNACVKRVMEVCLKGVKALPTATTPVVHGHGLVDGRAKAAIDVYENGCVADGITDEQFTWEDFFHFWDPPSVKMDAT